MSHRSESPGQPIAAPVNTDIGRTTALYTTLVGEATYSMRHQPYLTRQMSSRDSAICLQERKAQLTCHILEHMLESDETHHEEDDGRLMSRPGHTNLIIGYKEGGSGKTPTLR